MNQTSPTFFSELRRRRILPIAGAYIAIAWLATQVASFLLEQISAPFWSIRLLAIGFVVGFPVAVVIAWVIEVQPGGKWVIDSSKGQRRTVISAIVLGIAATAGLAWLILPGLEKPAPYPPPIPHSVGILPLADPAAMPYVRSVAQTLSIALREGLYQSPELALIRLDLDARPADPVAFGREYRIAALLMGRILQEAGSTRVEIELLDIDQGTVRWSQSFDWNPREIMDTVTAIDNGVLEAMELPLLSRQKFTGTDNQDAYEAVLLGWEHVASYRLEDVARAMEDFQRAIKLDPGFAIAYANLAWAIEVYKRFKGPPESERQALDARARQALETALELDGESATVLSQLGQMTENRELRIQLLEHALEIDPNHAHTYVRLAMQSYRDGKLEDAERLYRKSLELNPMDAADHHNLGELLWDMGRTAEAVAEIRKAIELEPEMPQNHRLLGIIELFSHGRIDNAIIYGRKAFSLDPESGGLAGFIATSYADLGAREEALAWIGRSLQLSPTGGWSLTMAYFTYLMLGDEDAALVSAEKMLKLWPDDYRALSLLGKRDIEEGRVQLALDRWHIAYPVLAAGDDPACDLSNYFVIIQYAENLMQAGQPARASLLAESCLPVLANINNKVVPESNPSRVLVLLGQKKESLEALRKEIEDGHRRNEASFRFKRPEYDFIRDEPEFRRLMAIIETDLAAQLKRIREMERNGELAPAPGVGLDS